MTLALLLIHAPYVFQDVLLQKTASCMCIVFMHAQNFIQLGGKKSNHPPGLNECTKLCVYILMQQLGVLYNHDSLNKKDKTALISTSTELNPFTLDRLCDACTCLVTLIPNTNLP